MGSVISLVLLAAGAALAWAVDTDAGDMNVEAIGVVLMVLGSLGLLWAAGSSSATSRRRTDVEDRSARHV